jgi:hypothetical protein
MNEKECCELMLKLADFRMTRVGNRREHEWKVTVALWALLAAGIVYLPQKNPSACWLVPTLIFVWLGHAYLWVGGHWARSKEDILGAFYYIDRAHNLLRPSVDAIQDLRRKDPEAWPDTAYLEKWYAFLSDRRCWAQIGTTFILANGILLACIRHS